MANVSPQQICGNIGEAIHATCTVSDILVHDNALWLKSSSAVHSYLALSQRSYSGVQGILSSVEGCEGIPHNTDATRAAGFYMSFRVLLNSLRGLPYQRTATA